MFVVAGPDGSGKTLVTQHLIGAARTRGPVLHLHHRPQVLPGASQHDGPVTEPHRQAAYPRPLAALKLLYIFLDYALGWAFSLGPTRRAGGTVILERGWWDMAVDPLRYRLPALPHLHRLLGRFLPQPDHTIVLEAPTEVLLARKAELPADELDRQRRAWQNLAAQHRYMTLWDATRPAEDVVPFVFSDRSTRREEQRWVGLPPSPAPRWVVPRAPGRLASRSLRIHRPISSRAVAGWSLGYGLAAAGALRLLPGATPEAWIMDRVAPLVPSGGTIATARSNHASRAIALILNDAGHAVWVAKVSCDPISDAQLAAEAAAVERYAPLLTAPVRGPSVEAAEPGLLVFEAISWQHQLVHWKLDPAVAASLGRLYSRTREQDGTGLGHGDVAPWNLLRTRKSWYLVDWEEAGPGFLPFHDLFHHLVQCHALLGHPGADAIIGGLRGQGWVGLCLRAYATAAELDVDAAEHYLAAYLDRSIPAGDATRRDVRRGRDTRHALLAQLRST